MKVVAVDQSKTGTAICVLDDGKKVSLETVTLPETVKGFDRISRILDRVREVLVAHQPQIFVMEDYSVGPSATTMIGLIELGGCIKLLAHQLAFATGREAVLRGERVFLTQSASSMKKFVLGQGNVTKDTSYLLKVHQRLQIAFDNDNEADAYMHAVMASLVYKVTRGEVPISNLTEAQQEAIIAHGVKLRKQLSMAKAMKLSDPEKLKLAGF